MKGLSVLLTILLLWLVHELSSRMHRAGTLPAQLNPRQETAPMDLARQPPPARGTYTL